MTAIGYLRHTQKSGPGPEGLAEQAARIRAHCEGRGWALAEVVTEERSWWRQGLVGLVDLGWVRALEANPRARWVVMSGEALAELEAEASATWGRVRAWSQARGVRVVAVDNSS